MSQPDRHSLPHLLGGLALVWVGVASRAVTDKLLALFGGGELIAAVAQLGNISDFVGGASMSGLGMGVIALVAQARRGERDGLLMCAVWISTATSSAVAAGAAALLAWTQWPVVPAQYQPLLPWALANGVLGVVPSLWNAALVGRGALGRAMLLQCTGIAVPLAFLALNVGGAPLTALLLGNTLFFVLSGGIWLWLLRAGRSQAWEHRAKLLRFVPAGLSIGLLSPASLTLARLTMAHELSWAAVGQVQALWRTAEWVTLTTSGMLSYYFLPRLSRASGSSAAFERELHATLRWLVLPSVAALALAWLALPLIQPLLYSPELATPREQAWLFFCGDSVRLVAWVYLYALYARAAGRAIALGELLSLPLFALSLVLAGPALSIPRIGGLWAFAFSAYALFNWAATRRAGRALRVQPEPGT